MDARTAAVATVLPLNVPAWVTVPVATSASSQPCCVWPDCRHHPRWVLLLVGLLGREAVRGRDQVRLSLGDAGPAVGDPLPRRRHPPAHPPPVVPHPPGTPAAPGLPGRHSPDGLPPGREPGHRPR